MAENTGLPSAQDKGGSLARIPLKVWHWLLEPSPSLQGPDRRQARLLMSMLLVMLVLSVLATGIAVPFVGGPNFDPLQDPTFLAGVSSVVIMAVAYALSRTRQYLRGAGLALGIFFVLPFLVAYFTPPEYSIIDLLLYPTLTVLLASIFFSVRATFVVSAANLAFLLLLGALRPDITPATITAAFTFDTVMPALILVATRHRNFLELDRQAELRKANEALRASVEKERAATALAHEANRLKSEFIATMSHELRTPLNAIIGFTEIMLEGMGGKLDKDANHMTERVKANSGRLLALIDDILDLAKIEARRVEVVKKPFSPRRLADDFHSRMMSIAHEKGLDFEVHVAPALPPRLLSDEDLIQKIVANLLSNAFKFTEKGSVRLSLDAGKQDTWTISVKDTGIGIPPHALEYIFDEFRQVDGTSTRVYGGTGLGLTITRQSARLLDGSVHVQSTLGQGSTFVVTLPLLQADEAVAMSRPDQVPAS